MRASPHKFVLGICLAATLCLALLGVRSPIPGARAAYAVSQQAGTAFVRSAALDRECYAAGQMVGILVEVDTTLDSQNVRVELKLLDPSGTLVRVILRSFDTHGDEDDSFVESLALQRQAGSGTFRVEVTIYDVASGAQQDVWSAPLSVDRSCGTVTPVISETPTRTPTPTATTTSPPPAVSGLLVVTSSTRLSAKFGNSGWSQIHAAIMALRATLLDVTLNSYQQVDAEIERIGKDRISVILIVGNHDVVPFSVLDNPTTDPDTLYTDDVYGDFDHDAEVVIDVPIARIPDGNDLGLVLTQLSGTALPASGGFSLANNKRPVAGTVANIFGASTLWSAPTVHSDIQASAVGVRHDYFMLHGAKNDTSTWWGEGTSPKYPAAFKVHQASSRGIVLTGACYGAYVLGKTPDNSIALRFLKSGVRAFVGCTGIHYSVLGTEPNDNGQLFHKIFWSKVVAGQTPLQAFYETKREYLAQTAQRPVNRKIEHQFVFYGAPGV